MLVNASFAIPLNDLSPSFETYAFSVGNSDGDVSLSAYQVSVVGMAMIRDEIVDATTDPSLMRVRDSTSQKYVPDVFYKYKNEYQVLVQEKAQPTFPVDYLLVSVRRRMVLCFYF